MLASSCVKCAPPPQPLCRHWWRVGVGGKGCILCAQHQHSHRLRVLSKRQAMGGDSLFHHPAPCPTIQVWGQGGQRVAVHQPQRGHVPSSQTGNVLNSLVYPSNKMIGECLQHLLEERIKIYKNHYNESRCICGSFLGFVHIAKY